MIANLRLFLFIALALIASPSIASEQRTERDIAYVLDVLKIDYAGWETKTADDRKADFDREVALARERIMLHPEARLWALGMLLDWFDDGHLAIRSKIVSPPNPWAAERTPRRAYRFVPEPGKDFAIVRLSPRTIMIRVPDFRPEHAGRFAALLAQHHDEIRATPHLLVDLRGNAGGGDSVYAPLMAYLYTRPITSVGAEVRNTGRNLAEWRHILADGKLDADTSAFLESFLKRAAATKAKWVPMDERGFSITTFPQVYPLPHRVGILTEGAGSSGDQFVIDARSSSKVTLLGAPTAGIIDYSNVVTATAPSGDFELAWPISRSMRLPQEPLDGTGVPVDVPYPANVTDQVKWAQTWLESRPD